MEQIGVLCKETIIQPTGGAIHTIIKEFGIAKLK